MNPDHLERSRRLVQTPAGALSCIDVGHGPIALFLHGIGTNALLWRNVIATVAGDDRRCIALDLPLHGHSPAGPDQDFSLPALAACVEAICSALDLDAVDLVANDTGGAVAQVFAVHHPDRLRTLTLTNCEAHDNVPPKALRTTVWAARLGLIERTGPRLVTNTARARKAVFSAGYQSPEQPPDEIVDAFLRPLLGTRDRAQQFQRLLTTQRAADLLAVEPGLRSLDVPTLIVWGTDDRFFDLRWASWLRDTIAGATEVVEIDGGRLFFPDERADELIPHLRDHWLTGRRDRCR